MLIAHLLVNAQTLPRATDVADESVANDTREPVQAPCGTPRRSTFRPPGLEQAYLSAHAAHRQAPPRFRVDVEAVGQWVRVWHRFVSDDQGNNDIVEVSGVVRRVTQEYKIPQKEIITSRVSERLLEVSLSPKCQYGASTSTAPVHAVL
jgi:hypothetical protein